MPSSVVSSSLVVFERGSGGGQFNKGWSQSAAAAAAMAAKGMRLVLRRVSPEWARRQHELYARVCIIEQLRPGCEEGAMAPIETTA